MADGEDVGKTDGEGTAPPDRPAPPTREEAERKAFWKKVATVAAGVAGVAVGLLAFFGAFRRGPRA